MAIDLRPTPHSPDDDPYLWLEEIEGGPALAWIDQQNARTLARFGGDEWHGDSAILTGLFDRPDNIPYVRRRGKLLFNFWQDAANPKGVWRTTTLESYRTSEPAWSLLLDVDALASQEQKDWVWGAASVLPRTFDRAIIRLSPGGSDAVELREFDLTRRAFCPDGFALPMAKSATVWLDHDTLLVISAHGDGMATTSGYARTIRIWRRGDDVDQLSKIGEVPEHYMVLFANVVAKREPETLWFVAMPSFFEREYWVGDRTEMKTRLELPLDADAELEGDSLVVRLRTDWHIAGINHAAGSLLAIGFDAFLAGRRDFAVIFAPSAQRVLKDWTWAGAHLVLSILDDLQPVFQLLTPGDWRASDLPGLPKLGIVQLGRLDADSEGSDGTLIANAQDPCAPPTLMLRPHQQDRWTMLKQAPDAFDAAGLVCRRHEAISTDGERIPYFQIGPREAETGDAPVHLYGYGGFESPVLPNYRVGVGKLWLERGGTSVIACIRGGGEFGPRWHAAGRREHKHLSHDDFAAVAADLVARGVTHPKRIAAEGGSNGGILISNMFTRYPERFGALFCTIPLIDMRRYSKLLAGASWIAEYGDPDDPEDWAFLKTYSAYHQVKPPEAGNSYPAILLATTRRDDRVHPGHARKMAAKLHAIGHEAYFYEPASGGHGYGKDNSERAAFMALGYRFLRQGIDWTDLPSP